MATFGEALAALEEFRTTLVDQQLNLSIPTAEAAAFRGAPASRVDSPLGNVHATGVGVREGRGKRAREDFVIKVYMFDKAGVASASAMPMLANAMQGVDVDVEHLPVQFAYAGANAGAAPRRAAKRRTKAAAAANPAQHRRRIRPSPAGVEIGPLGGNFVGTLGCFVRRGADGPIFALSNNHVLANVNRFAIGAPFTQPFSSNPNDVLLTLAGFEPILFPAPGSQPRNVIDAAIGRVVNPNNVVLGRMLNIANYTPQLMAAVPGTAVTKAGRTTGVTTGTIRAIRVRGVQVNYGTLQQPIIATFDNAITIAGPPGQPFSNPGDSGSAILDQRTGRPVALLFAGNGATTTACDIAVACNRFGVHPI
jgi:hypothetical protein